MRDARVDALDHAVHPEREQVVARASQPLDHAERAAGLGGNDAHADGVEPFARDHAQQRVGDRRATRIGCRGMRLLGHCDTIVS